LQCGAKSTCVASRTGAQQFADAGRTDQFHSGGAERRHQHANCEQHARCAGTGNASILVTHRRRDRRTRSLSASHPDEMPALERFGEKGLCHPPRVDGIALTKSEKRSESIMTTFDLNGKKVLVQSPD